MAVRYIRVDATADLFAPAVRSFGNVAVVGTTTSTASETPAANDPQPFTNPSDALAAFPGPLGDSIEMVFKQSPGPALVYGVRMADANGIGPALTALETANVQIVVLAATPLDATTGAAGPPPGAIVQLRNHVHSVSTTGEDGRERIGVAMLPRDSTDTSVVTGDLAHERMVYIAHKSDQDAAAALAGTIAGYEPHVSLVLKPVSIATDLFTSAQIETINGSETFRSGPAATNGVNWFTDPVLIPGRGIYTGEAYTGDPGGKKYIDIVRTVDDVAFRLKARLIRSIGTLRISRSGLRSLVAQMEAVLDPLVRLEVMEGYRITVPILTLLDKDPAALTDAEITQINNVQNERVAEVLVEVDYAGAIHRIALTLRFR